MTGAYEIRAATPADYDRIATVVDDWWGRAILPGLPRLFLDHFHSTSLIAADGQQMIGFLVGFLSPSNPTDAYIHYVAVDPVRRADGVARHLYEHFEQRVVDDGRSVIRAITSVGNKASIAFHTRLGFTVSAPVPDYNGPGRDMITFTRMVDRTGQ